jgi:circadian clock protein KaiB
MAADQASDDKPQRPEGIEGAVEVPLASAKKYVHKLYVTGKGSESVRVFQAIKRFCDQRLPGKYQLWVIDVLIQPDQAKDIEATPTLVKTKPAPPRKIVSDFTNPELVFAALGIPDPNVEEDT